MAQLELDAALVVRSELARWRRELPGVEVGGPGELEPAHGDVVRRHAHARVERTDRVLVERATGLGVALADDVALPCAERDLERRAAVGVVRLHVEIELVRLDVDVVDREVHLAVGDRERVEREVNRARLLLRLLRLEREVLELAVLDDEARARRVDVDLVDEQLAAHQREEPRVHRGSASRQRRTAPVGRLDLHVRELERERPDVHPHVEAGHDALIAERLRRLLHRPVTGVGRADEPDRDERQHPRDGQNDRQNTRERPPHLGALSPPGHRREARFSVGQTGHGTGVRALDERRRPKA